MTFDSDISPILSLGLQGLFFLLLLFFTFHAIVLAYHLLKYGESKSSSTLALAIYLGGGAILLITYAVALGTF